MFQPFRARNMHEDVDIIKNAFHNGEKLPKSFIIHQRSDFIIHFSLKIRVWDE